MTQVQVQDDKHWSMSCVRCDTNCDTYETNFSTPYGVEERDTRGGEILFSSTLEMDGREVRGYLTKTEFYWTTGKVNTSYIIAVNYDKGPSIKESDRTTKKTTNTTDNNNTDDSVELDSFPGQYFVLHFCKRIKNKWKPQSVLFHADDPVKCQSWVEGIRNIIKDFQRPKNLIVFLNPSSGRKQAEKIYHEKAEELFNVAKVNATKIVTERANHARDYIEQGDLSNYDGIVCVGGDGLCSEIVNGMLKYEDDSHQVKMNKTNTPIMLGIIPAGSTDTVAYCTSGTNDPITASINIILGRQLPLDICSVWQDGHFVKYSLSMMAYGYFGDLIKESQNFQSLGPRRYDLAGFKRFMINRSYEGEVKFLKTYHDHNDRTQCKANCLRCLTFNENEEGNWESSSGRFLSVIGANMSCRCAKSSTGISPMAHIGDGCIDLILLRKTTRLKYLNHLVKVSNKTTEQFDFNFIERHRVKEFSFTPTSRSCSSEVDSFGSTVAISRSASASSVTSVWNVDGELVEHPSLHIKVHRHLISVFASGIDE